MLRQFVRFAGVGAIGTAVQYAVLGLLVEAVNADPIIASSLGFMLGAVTNYILNYHYTFKSNKSHMSALPKFLSVATLGLIWNGLIMALCIDTMELYYWVAQILATGVVLIWNFSINRLWTFRESPDAPR